MVPVSRPRQRMPDDGLDHRRPNPAWDWLELPDSLMLQVDPCHPELAHAVLARAEQKTPGPLHVEVTGT